MTRGNFSPSFYLLLTFSAYLLLRQSHCKQSQSLVSAQRSESSMSVSEKHTHEAHHAIRTTKSHVKLVPQPTDDPRDPLNWSLAKKIFTLVIVSYSSFVAVAQAICQQSDFVVQGKYYGKTPTEMSYTVSPRHVLSSDLRNAQRSVLRIVHRPVHPGVWRSGGRVLTTDS